MIGTILIEEACAVRCSWHGIAALLLLASLGLVAGPAFAQPLYEGSSGDLPTESPWDWLYGATGQATAQASGGVTIIDSSADSADQIGFTTHYPYDVLIHPHLVPLNRNTGFRLEFGAQIVSEAHQSNDRAGFSVIVLSNDALGIELAFWEDEIWAQNSDFTKGESSGAFDTTSGLIDYRLEILGTGYTLFADDNEIRDGSLRDYSAFSGGPFLDEAFPYDRANFTFFGDDTSSAAAEAQVSYFRVVVPEPSSLVLAGLGGLLVTLALLKVRRAGSTTDI